MCQFWHRSSHLSTLPLSGRAIFWVTLSPGHIRVLTYTMAGHRRGARLHIALPGRHLLGRHLPGRTSLRRNRLGGKLRLGRRPASRYSSKISPAFERTLPTSPTYNVAHADLQPE